MTECTCGGTAPGYPQHELKCGEPENDGLDDPCDKWDDEDDFWAAADRAYEVNR